MVINLINMCSSMWYMSVLTLLIVDVRTGALLQREGSVHECHVCVPSNNTTCEQSSKWSSVLCPVDRPFCATIAMAPNFRSSLTCSAALKPPCSLTYSSQNTLSLNCACTEHLCNVPFSRKLRNELLNFSSKNNTSANQTETFFKMITANITDVSLYKRITGDIDASNKKLTKNNSQLTTLSSVPINENSHTFTTRPEFRPRVEALKQESTAPSDDDEDENEGSGSYEETKTHSPPASAPAAPSSFLPANENYAPTLFYNLYLTTYLIAQIII